MTVTITLDPEGHPDPAYLRAAAAALPVLVRVLAHQACHSEALGEPAAIAGMLQEISLACQALPRVLTQVRGHLAREDAAGRLEVTRGKYQGHPDTAVTDLWAHVDEASAALLRAAAELDDAAEIASAMAVADPG